MLVLVLTELGAPETVEAQVAFHLAAGVDLVLVRSGSTHPALGHEAVCAVAEGTGWDAAAARYGADWIVEAGAGEFWVPAGGSLADVVGAAPVDVDAIQGLERRPPAATLVPDGAFPSSTRRRLIRRPGAHSTLLRGWFPAEIVSGDDPRVLEVLRRAAVGEAPAFPRRSAVDDPRFGAEVAVWFEEDLRETDAVLAELEPRVARLGAPGLRGRAARLAHRVRRRRSR